MTPATAIDPATLQAYRETEYRVAGIVPLILRVGVLSTELAMLHQRYQTNCSGLITAYNAMGELVANAVNLSRHEALVHELACRRLVGIPAVGQHPHGAWPAEPSFLVPNLTFGAAQELGHQFQQNAVIWSGPEAVPELILLR